MGKEPGGPEHRRRPVDAPLAAATGAPAEGLHAASESGGRRDPGAHAGDVGSVLQPARDLETRQLREVGQEQGCVRADLEAVPADVREHRYRHRQRPARQGEPHGADDRQAVPEAVRDQAADRVAGAFSDHDTLRLRGIEVTHSSESRMRAIAVLVLLAGSALVSAQSAASGPPPAFEVASVKPNNSGASGSSSYTGKGRLTATNVQLRLLIAQAYGIPSNRIAAPNWIDSARFDINARALENTPDSQTNLMLRSLLVDRFKLAARTEMRDQPIYALVVADKGGKLGPFLQPAAECDKKPMMGAPTDARAVFPQAVLGV